MVKVFSFCLYGSNPKYTTGVIENIKIINQKFPEWFTYVYYDDVPENVLDEIKTYNNIELLKSNYTGAKTMLDRFKPIDNKDVEIMMVRDVDSRIHNRDIWAIKSFIKSDKQFHIIRDHKWHTALVMGGLWGIKQGLLKFNIENDISKYCDRWPNQQQVDQIYLINFLYPEIKNHTLIHGILKMDDDEDIIPFPCPIKDYDFCGQVIDYYTNGVPYKVFDENGFKKN